MKTKTEQNAFVKWFTQNPRKLLILVLLIVLPVFIIILTTVSVSKRYTRFHFSNSADDIQYVHQGKVSSLKKINRYTNFNVDLVKVGSYTTNDETFDRGRFTFRISHDPKPFYAKSIFTFEGVLNANYFDDQLGDYKKKDDEKEPNVSRVESFTPNSNTNNPYEKTFNYPFNTPNRKLLLFKVGDPSLYIKITIKYVPINSDLPSNDETIVLYYKYNVNKDKSYDID